MASRNGHDFWVLLFSLLDAMLRLETFSSHETHDDCHGYLARARALGHAPSIQISLVLLSKAQLAIGDLNAAQETFDEIIRWQSGERILMDWIWRLPLQFNYVELCLTRRDFDAAVEASELFLVQAGRTAEKTWTVLAHLTRAKIAAIQQEKTRFEREIAAGLELVETHNVPLAAWRLHAFMAQTLGSFEHRERALQIVRKLADSLEAESELKRCFLSAPDVATVVGVGRQATAT
jgi:hypothetical protein